MATIDKKWLVDIKGKQFVLFAGLLDVAHQSGLIGIENEVVRELSVPEKDRWVVRSIGRFRGPEGEAIWQAYGDADPSNSQMRGAYLRHAETRAAARMLRMSTNIGTCSVEELGPDMGDDPLPTARPTAKQWCTADACGNELTKSEISASAQRGWPPLCTQHGRERNAREKATVAA